MSLVNPSLIKESELGCVGLLSFPWCVASKYLTAHLQYIVAKDHFEEIVSTIVLSGTVHTLVRQMSIELQISIFYLIFSFTVSDYQIKPKGEVEN